MLKQMLDKIKEVGVWNTIIGIIRREYYKKLKRKYDLYSWHISPYELRKYAQDVVRYINSDSDITNEVIDLGCGLGEIIRNIKADKRYGLDLDESAITVARMLDKSHLVDYSVGSFDAIEERRIEYLITLNFMHGESEEYWAPIYQNVCEKNDIKKIMVDILMPIDDANRLDFSHILPENYRMIWESGPYLGHRLLQCWEKEE